MPDKYHRNKRLGRRVRDAADLRVQLLLAVLVVPRFYDQESGTILQQPVDGRFRAALVAVQDGHLVRIEALGGQLLQERLAIIRPVLVKSVVQDDAHLYL